MLRPAYWLGLALTYRFGRTPAYRLGVMRAVCLTGRIDPRSGWWDEVAAPGGPRMRSVGSPLGFACGAHAHGHEALSVSGARHAPGQPQWR